MLMDLAESVSTFAYNGATYSIVCLYQTKNFNPTFAFHVDGKDANGRRQFVCRTLLVVNGDGAPAMNADVRMRALLNTGAERPIERITAGERVPMALDSTYWR